MQASGVPQGAATSESHVIVSEEARDTPACESDAVSALAVEGAHTTRTQHGRDALG